MQSQNPENPILIETEDYIVRYPFSIEEILRLESQMLDCTMEALGQ